MKKINKKVVNVLTTAALVASIASPVFANSTNLVTKTPSVDDDYKSTVVPAQDAYNASTPYQNAISTLIIKKDDTDINAGERFRLVLSEGVKWVEDAYEAGGVASTVYGWNGSSAVTSVRASVTSVSEQSLEIVLNDNLTTNELRIPLYTEVDGATGPLKVRLESIDGTLTNGEYTFANVSAGTTNAVVEKVETFTEQGTVGTIRIDETAIGSIYNSGNAQKITLKLPNGYEWVTAPTLEFAGGFANVQQYVYKDSSVATTVSNDSVNLNAGNNAYVNERTLEFYVKFGSQPTTRGTLYLKGGVIKATDDDKYGDVTLSISGDKVATQDVLLAKHADYNVEITADDPKELFAGRGFDDTNELKLAKLKINEKIAGSLLANRKTEVEFPEWVKVVGVKVDKLSNSDITASTLQSRIESDIDGKENKVEFILNDTTSSNKIEAEITFYVSVKAGSEGDITAKVSGRSTAKGDVVLGKVVPPVKISGTKTEVKAGLKDQPVGEFFVTETKKEGIKKGELILELDYDWGTKPNVEVVEGDIDLDLENIVKSGTQIKIPVKSESTKPSKIKFSGGTVDLDRAVPYGEIEVAVKGSAVVGNHKTTAKNFSINGESYNIAANDSVDAVEFDKSSQGTVVVASVVTPIDNNKAAEAKFVIGSTKYTVDGVEKTADVAPFIQDGRTFLPIRFVAEAVGVTESNIIWNANTKTVTLIKGDRIAQIQVGSKNLVVNGVSVPMDTKAFVKDGRTVLPLRYVAQALGADIAWDEATKTVTINNK